MNRPSILSLSIASLSLALLLPACAQGQDQNGGTQGQQNGSMQGQQNDNMQGQNNPPLRGRREAMRMVPARAALQRTLNADKDKPGSEFRAVLSKKVQLDNGPELPEGTILLGRVAADDMNEGGTSKLALRFTQADLKDGQVVPIKATIVGVYRPESTGPEGYPIAPGDEVPNSWNDGTLAVDQIGVMSGVDLHSKISSRNSGVFVSPKDKDVKLGSGTEIALAIAANPRGGRNRNRRNPNGQYPNGQNPGQNTNGQNPGMSQP